MAAVVVVYVANNKANVALTHSNYWTNTVTLDTPLALCQIKQTENAEVKLSNYERLKGEDRPGLCYLKL